MHQGVIPPVGLKHMAPQSERCTVDPFSQGDATAFAGMIGKFEFRRETLAMIGGYGRVNSSSAIIQPGRVGALHIPLIDPNQQDLAIFVALYRLDTLGVFAAVPVKVDCSNIVSLEG